MLPLIYGMWVLTSLLHVIKKTPKATLHACIKLLLHHHLSFSTLFSSSSTSSSSSSSSSSFSNLSHIKPPLNPLFALPFFTFFTHFLFYSLFFCFVCSSFGTSHCLIGLVWFWFWFWQDDVLNP
ncbi:hypothetical protein Csa_009628 [Cucumis sativus]|nr:hypothetical protein Csa_009628 [Cucumis sativus]